jgi:hypothetical protein
VGPTPSPRPRRAQRWRRRFALGGALRQSPNGPIAHRIRRRRERPELQRVRRFHFGIGGVRRPSPRPACRAGPRRCTWPRSMADRRRSPSCSCAAPTGPSRTATGNAALRRTADRTVQPRACRYTPKQLAEEDGKLAERCRKRAQYKAAETQVHSARRLPTSPGLARHPCPRPLCRRMCRRCSPSALADPAGRGATAHAALAL